MSQSVRLFIGNLSWKTTSESLKRAFQNAVGAESSVVNAHVVMDRYSGRSKYVLHCTVKLNRELKGL
jgi:RNA recognition motif-containing protein